MKKIFYFLSACALTISAVSCSDKSDNDYRDENGNPRDYSLEGEKPTKMEKMLGDSFSYYMGMDIGNHMKSQIEYQKKNNPNGPELNIEKFIRGVESVIYADTTDNYSYVQGQGFALQFIFNSKVNLASSNVPFNEKLLIQGIKKAFNDTINAGASYQGRMRDFQTQINVLQQRKDSVKRSIEKVVNEEKGKAFIDSVKNADKDVKTSKSGLSYKILAKGDDQKPVMHDGKVKLNYKGTKTDGEVFDETKGQPREFPTSGFIPGFVEGIELLGEGGKAILYIPGELAYGERGVPQINIGPDETLIFEVEVVEVIDPVVSAQ